MNELILIEAYPIKDILKYLLQDKTTKKNIIFASDSYIDYGEEYTAKSQMTEKALLGINSCDIQPRIYKTSAEQVRRTRKKAEVFTPAWIVNKMINYCDAEWFGHENVFNFESPTAWITNIKPAEFPEGKDWKTYVDSRRLEITCGEAPYIVSRYDTSTGEVIPIDDRIGILDRKLRVVGENTDNEEDWLKWAIRAYQSVYGYEYQGDNVLIARINMIYTFCDHVEAKWKRKATIRELKKLANIICWNLWQMDGLQDTTPCGAPHDDSLQMSLFDDDNVTENESPYCRVYDWRAGKSMEFRDIKKRGKGMKFDFVIGNPPYQETTDTYNRQTPIYPLFYDAAECVSDKVMLITPARFLFNAGLTSKDWNKKMLSDTHLRVEQYFEDACTVFPNTDIKGGVAIVYYDQTQKFGAINEFIPNDSLRKIASHFTKDTKTNLPAIMFGGRSDLKFNSVFVKEHPESVDARLNAVQVKHPNVTKLAPNEEYELKSSTLDILSFLFLDKEPKDKKDYYKILGLKSGKRVYRWIECRYMDPRYPSNNNICAYKTLFPEANASGVFGEIMGQPVVLGPMESATPSFISIGCFDNEIEAINVAKYIKTKLVRALLGLIKKTQHTSPSSWAYVPLQDFTPSSDIDWTKSISDIDKQLYKKYGLSQEEIDFIETHVKEMA